MPSMAGDRGAAVRHAQRASGQASAVAAMIAGGRPFADVAQQVLATRGSLDSLLLRLVELELAHCLPSASRRGEVNALLCAALGRSGAGFHRTRTTARSALKERTSP